MAVICLVGPYGWFTEGFDTPVLQDAKALLDQLVAHHDFRSVKDATYRDGCTCRT